VFLKEKIAALKARHADVESKLRIEKKAEKSDKKLSAELLKRSNSWTKR